MDESRQKGILRLAVDLGHVTDQQWAGIISRSVKEKRDILDLVREDGLLTDDVIAELETCLDAEPESEKATRVISKESRERFIARDHSGEFDLSDDQLGRIRELPADHGFPKGWERYTFVKFLGEGGMGRVFLAEDPRLKRQVAIKFVRGIDSESEQRFINEARAQAQVSHDNLCEIFEVGEVDGRAYIVMAYVDGGSLNEACRNMLLEQKVKAMKEVAEGVHEAHRSGLIHRDLKPSNIMVQRNEIGGYKPVVMDFGLARLQSAPGMTETGSVVGTPHYMPPEQARGEVHRLDRRTDVYSLGATLYEMLAGKPPFTGISSVNVLFKVINDDPKPIRQINPSVPSDLETIVFKCMEKDQSKRYDSARAMAEDLGHFLDGEPIRARPAGMWYRLRKKAAKNKLAVGIGLVAFLAVSVSLSWGVYSKWAADQKARLTREFTREAQAIEESIRSESLIPIHDMSRYLDEVGRRTEVIAKRVESAGRFGEGPGKYALGRAYLALKDYDRAQALLQEAWDSGFKDPGVAYELGRVLGILYQRELEYANLLSMDRDLEKTMEELDRKYREPAARFLKMTPDDVTSSPEYLEALLAYYDKDYETALEKARAAYHQKGWLYEAYTLEGDIYRARGQERWNKEDDSARADYLLAKESYERAINIGRSYIDAYLGLCRTGKNLMLLEFIGSGSDSISEYFDMGIRSGRDALSIDPNNVMAHVYLSDLNRLMADVLDRRGRNPESLQEKAIEYAQKALALDAENPEVMEQLGAVYYSKGRYERRQGRNPEFYHNKAHSSLKRGIGIEPTYSRYNRLGNVFLDWSRYLRSKGGEAEKLLDQALQAYDKALEQEPRYDAYNNKASAYSNKASLLEEQGEDATEYLDQAIDVVKKALSIKKDARTPHYNLGLFHVRRALMLQENGRDPLPSYAAAEESFKQATQIDPRYISPLRASAWALIEKSEYLWDIGRDPFPSLDKALANSKLAESINPDRSDVLLYKGRALMTRYRFQCLTGQNPSDQDFQEANFAFTKVTANNRGVYLEALAYRAELFLASAQRLHSLNRDYRPSLRQAEKCLEEALSINDITSPIHITTARISLFAGSKAVGKQAGEWYAKATQAAREAIEKEKSLLIGYQLLAKSLIMCARASDPSSETHNTFLEEAKAILEELRTRDKDNAPLYFLQGLYYRTLWEHTKQDNHKKQENLSFEEAFKQNPNLRDVVFDFL
ncbi:MAG: protein kinase [Acidobacteriota bacterium]|nr:protein kinase [Acidobacteriota bacterium]